MTGAERDEPLTHFFHCWRFPDHHRCAVALIERQGEENTQLIVRAAALERVIRDRAAAGPLRREDLGRIVRETWVAWALDQPDPKPSWLTGWDDLDAGQREVDMRIGEAVAAAVNDGQ